MARQAGPLFITGTVDDVVFYQMNGKYYMRLKGAPTPITKKRMSQKEHYPVLYMRKQEFKAASQMVKKWYYTLPKTVRKHGLFGTLTGKAVRWLRQGKTEEEIKALGLKAALPKQKETETEKVAKPVENNAAVSLIEYTPLTIPKAASPLHSSKAAKLQDRSTVITFAVGYKQTKYLFNHEAFIPLKTLTQQHHRATTNSLFSIDDSC